MGMAILGGVRPAAKRTRLARSIKDGRLDEKKRAAQRLLESSPDEIDLVVPALVGGASGQRRSGPRRGDPRDRSVRLFGRAAHPRGLGDQARAAANGLLGALKNDTDPIVRASAAFALASMRQALIKAGLSSDKSLESDPIKRETLFAALDEALQQDLPNRLPLIDAIERLGPLPNVATPGLVEALKDPSIIVRGRLILTLSHFTGGVDPAIPVLLNDLEQNTSRFLPDYLGAAKEMHPSPAVVPILIKSLESGNWMVREAAALLIAQIGTGARAAAPAVIAAVKKTIAAGNDRNAQGDPARAPQNPGALAKTGTRPDEPPRGSVSAGLATALARVAPAEEAVPILLEALRSKNTTTLASAATGLAELGPKAAQAAIPILLAALKESFASDEDSAEQSSVVILLALGRVAPRSPETGASSEMVIAKLGDALNAPSPSIQAAAAEALGNFGQRASKTVPKLMELQKEKAFLPATKPPPTP